MNRHNSYGVEKSSARAKHHRVTQTGDMAQLLLMKKGSCHVCLCSYVGRDVCLERRSLERVEYQQVGC